MNGDIMVVICLYICNEKNATCNWKMVFHVLLLYMYVI